MASCCEMSQSQHIHVQRLRLADHRCSVRGVLARRMHALYLSEHAYVPSSSSQPASFDQPSPDNPDQRMTTDLTLLTQLLQRIMVEFGTAPFRIVFYSWWMWSYTGWLAVGVVYSFAAFGTLLQRSVRHRVCALKSMYAAASCSLSA